ncbi:Pectinesterase inhibitor domain containing protein [Parasponia andersonii]|uniref:Pectinesterase n=1 Tax=Parasponia andersonii TaxID=3476 RepID=A0A2P5CP02_PARAD|nr:Pectinesterase inhibitor domain containing protein [Parasponia andersonii]
MDHNLFILATFCTYFLLFFPLHVVHGTNNNTVTISPCNQTPYPHVCKHYIINTNNYLPSTLDDQNSVDLSFRDLALKVTMEQAVVAHRLVATVDSNSFDERGKMAWQDCIELYKDTVDLLNRSIESSSNINNNPLDTLTWLSASFANHQTCRNGFADFELSSSRFEFFPSMLSNFSKLLSNSLAIHKSFSTKTTSFIHGRRRLLSDRSPWPVWLSGASRKLLQSGAGATEAADIVVAQDGSGGYKTISEAVEAAAKLGGGSKRIVIHVKSGVYKENVEISKEIKNLMVIGDGIDATIVTGNRNQQDGSTTFQSATFAVSGDGFIAQDMTFENTAGPQKHQAVALRSGADHSVFYRCSFKGYQDTLYVYSQRQFYRDCDIYGTVDFIFGDAVAVIQNSNIYVRKPMSGQENTVTAQARTDPNENTGIIIHNSRITASSDLRPVQGSFETYLGRPWQKYSRTVIMKTGLDGLIDPAGWLPWSGNFALSTLYYAEFMNSGAGAGTGGRVNWPGYRVLTSAAEAEKFTVGNFLAGGSWIPATGVPFSADL